MCQWARITQPPSTVASSSTEHGALFTFGLGSTAALGNGTETRHTPSQVNYFTGGSGVHEVDCGANHTIVATKEGEVYTWGSTCEFFGKKQTAPTQVAFKSAISQVAAGDGFSLALEKGGHKLYIWGSFPGLGDCGVAEHPTELEEVTHLLHKEHSTIKRVKAADGAVAILLQNGKLFVFGNNKYGQLANNHMKGMSMLDSRGSVRHFHRPSDRGAPFFPRPHQEVRLIPEHDGLPY